MKDQWIGVSDLMSGLMMIFLFVSISLLIKEQSENKEIKQKIEKTREFSKKIKSLLNAEFREDFEKWGAVLLADGTIRFQTPEIMFSQGKDRIKNKFRQILKEFCPRYIGIMHNNFDQENIHEIRITGHTSSEWNSKISKKRHTSNAKLSLNRSWKVHEFCYDNLISENQKSWFSNKVVTVGASYVHKRKNDKGMENKPLSRRVEFRAQPKILSDLREYLYSR